MLPPSNIGANVLLHIVLVQKIPLVAHRYVELNQRSGVFLEGPDFQQF